MVKKYWPEILNVKGAASYLRLHPMTVYKLAREDRIPAMKVGGQWRFHKSKLEAFVLEGSGE